MNDYYNKKYNKYKIKNDKLIQKQDYLQHKMVYGIFFVIKTML